MLRNVRNALTFPLFFSARRIRGWAAIGNVIISRDEFLFMLISSSAHGSVISHAVCFVPVSISRVFNPSAFRGFFASPTDF